jgi:hypothetical protein
MAEDERQSEIGKILNEVAKHPRCPPPVVDAILDWFETDPNDLHWQTIDAKRLLESQGYKVFEPKEDE